MDGAVSAAALLQKVELYPDRPAVRFHDQWSGGGKDDGDSLLVLRVPARLFSSLSFLQPAAGWARGLSLPPADCYELLNSKETTIESSVG